MRYPGAYYPVTEEDYNRAIELAARVLDWVKAQVEEKSGD
jgi:HEPN domain-containing protein